MGGFFFSMVVNFDDLLYLDAQVQLLSHHSAGSLTLSFRRCWADAEDTLHAGPLSMGSPVAEQG